MDWWTGDRFPGTRKSMGKSIRKGERGRVCVKPRGPHGGGPGPTGLDPQVHVGGEGHRPPCHKKGLIMPCRLQKGS